MNVASSSYASLERTLDRTIECLTGSGQPPQARALLIEARRLRSVVANWRSIPPPPDVHDEMLERVLLLSTAVGAALPEAQPEPGPEEDPEISTTEALDQADEDDDVYTLDFEPHLYSLEGVTTTRREAIPPPAPEPEPFARERITATRDAAPEDVDTEARRRPPATPPTPPRRSSPPPVSSESSLPAWALAALAPVAEAPVEAPRVAAQGTSHGAADDGPTPRPPSGTSPDKPVTRARGSSAPPEAPAAARATTRPSSVPPPLPSEPAPEAPARASVVPAEPEDGEIVAVPRTVVTAHTIELAEPVTPLLTVYHEPYSAQADAYRALRRKLVSSGDPKVIGVTSAHAGEGKTVCALNLALTLRESARAPVLVVEANLRSPLLTKLLRFAAPECFITQLERHIDEPRAAWHAAELLPKLHVMAIDTGVKHDPLLNPVAFGTGMERLKQAGYEYILVDTPPVLGSVDCNVIADSMDGMLFAALSLKSKRKEMRKAVEQLEPAPILGVVVLEA